jgi:hypothetical protein
LYGAPGSLARRRSESASGFTAGFTFRRATAADTAGTEGSAASQVPGKDAGPPAPDASPEPSLLTLSAAEVRIKGGDLYRIVSDLKAFLESAPKGDPLSAVPLSLPLLPPVTADTLETDGTGLSLNGSPLFSLRTFRVKTPLEKGRPWTALETELGGFDCPALSLLRAAVAAHGASSASGAAPVASAVDSSGATGGADADASDASRAGPYDPPASDKAAPVPGLDVELSATYDLEGGDLDIRRLRIVSAGLFVMEAGLSFSGAKAPFLEKLSEARLPEARAPESRELLGSLGSSSFRLEYTDLGLLRNLLENESARAYPGRTAKDSRRALSASWGILALSRIDPVALNGPEIVTEISSFLEEPSRFAVTAGSPVPVALSSLGPGLVDPLRKDEAERDLPAMADFLSPLKVTISTGARAPVTARWRENPPAFMTGLNPTQTRHDGLGGLD